MPCFFKFGTASSLMDLLPRPPHSEYCRIHAYTFLRTRSGFDSHLSDHPRLIPSLHQLAQKEAEDHDHDHLDQVELKAAVYRSVSLNHPSTVGTGQYPITPVPLHQEDSRVDLQVTRSLQVEAEQFPRYGV